MEYEFTLKFELPDGTSDPEQHIDALFEAGCDDATIGVGQKGRIALDFTREASSALDAMTSAIENVKKAIPGARLIEATPDLVGMSDVAEIVGCSRQNMRKIFVNYRCELPSPVYSGRSIDLYHLYHVLRWLSKREDYNIEKALVEISHASMLLNTCRQSREVEETVEPKLKAQFKERFSGLIA